MEITSPFTSPTSFTLLELKKSPKVEGSNTKAKSAKPIMMIKNIERSLIFDKIAIHLNLLGGEYTIRVLILQPLFKLNSK